MKHTPGPWKWIRDDQDCLKKLVGPGNADLVLLCAARLVLSQNEMTSWIDFWREEDLMLIEAAPELLEAAIDLLAWLNSSHEYRRAHSKEFAAAKRKLYRAASKATGRVVEEVKS